MKWKIIQAIGETSEPGARTFALVFDKGDEFMGCLQDFAMDHRLSASSFTAIGAFSAVTLGYFDRERKGYKRIPIQEQVEVLSLIGNIAVDREGQSRIHAHVVVGKSDGSAWGGHILDAHVWPTLEVILTEEPHYLQRRIDPETGLPLIQMQPASG